MSDWQDRYGLIDWKGLLLTPRQMLDMAQTDEGRKDLFEYIMKARVAFSMQSVFDMLGVIPPIEHQQRACLLVYEAMFRVPVENILEYARQAAEGLADKDMGNA